LHSIAAPRDYIGFFSSLLVLVYHFFWFFLVFFSLPSILKTEEEGSVALFVLVFNKIFFCSGRVRRWRGWMGGSVYIILYNAKNKRKLLLKSLLGSGDAYIMWLEKPNVLEEVSWYRAGETHSLTTSAGGGIPDM